MSNVLVLGGGLPALAAALELASVGISVHIAEAVHGGSESAGSQNAASTPRWAPTSDVRDPDGEVTAFLGEIEAPIAEGGHGEPGAAAVHTPPARSWVLTKKGEWAPQPTPEVFGIPAVPLSTDCMRVLGTGGAFRAYLDRIKPVLTIGQQENLARLVESRMGASVRELLVEPFVRERFGVATVDAEVSVVAPRLNEGLSRVGSLSGGVDQHTDRHVARETTVAPAAGWQEFTTIVLERLALYGAQPFAPAVARLTPVDAGWIVHDESGAEHRFDAIVIDPSALANLSVGSDTSADTDADADADADADGEVGLARLAAAVLPAKLRTYAESGIHAPSWSPASDGETPLTLLQTVVDRAGNPWSLRVTRDADRSWNARLWGPAQPAHPEGTAPADAAEPVATVGATVAALLRDARLEPTSADPHSPQPVITMEVAPFVTERDRDRAAGALSAWEAARSDALVCGAEAHGGELGSALHEARQRAVLLRRTLLGISG